MDIAAKEGIQVDHWMRKAVKDAIAMTKLADRIKSGEYDADRGKNVFGQRRSDSGLAEGSKVEVHTTDPRHPVIEVQDNG